MYCNNCGAELPDGSRFCTRCGAKFDAGAQAPPAYPQYQPVQQPYVVLPVKSEILAMVLAFFIPGAGHLYAGKLVRGLLFMVSYFALTIISTVWVFSIIPNFNTPDPMVVMDALSGYIVLLSVLSLAGFIIWIAQLIDAYTVTKKYNDVLRQTGQAPW